MKLYYFEKTNETYMGFRDYVHWLRAQHKEEKKMLNIDKYRKEIDRMIENGGVPRYMLLRMCLQKTNLESIDTAEVLDWLFSEYEPPLLENGDGLKPGDWIMVRDEDDQIWKKERFLSFANGSFYCIKSLFGSHDGKTNRDLYGEFVCYRQARLPEGGE